VPPLPHSSPENYDGCATAEKVPSLLINNISNPLKAKTYSELWFWKTTEGWGGGWRGNKTFLFINQRKVAVCLVFC
jgi:hypothetical protein